MIFKLLKFFRKVPESNAFIYKNIFEIIKCSLNAVNDDGSLESLGKVEQNPILQDKFSKVFSNMYLDSIAAARYRDSQIIKRKGTNFRAELMFYSVMFTFIISSCLVVFYKNRLTPDSLAVISAIIGMSGSCLKEIFSFEFGNSVSISYKSKQYVLDQNDEMSYL